MTRFNFRGIVIGALLCVAAVTASAQSNPTPFDLSGGDYSFTEWSNAEPAGTYPESMVFHVFPLRIEPFNGTIDQEPNGDWDLPYNRTSRARINGAGSGGVEFFQTSSAQSEHCSYLGAAVLALNTSGRVNVNVSFELDVVNTGSRPYTIRLQYRANPNEPWQNALGADGDYVQHASATEGTSPKTYNWMMPLALEGEPEVQLRWLYFQEGFGSGGRPRMSIDDIFVTSDDPTAGAPVGLQVFSVSPQNPSRGIPFVMVVRPVDGSGNVVNAAANTSVSLAVSAGSGSLSGSTGGTISSGTSALELTNVQYNTAETGVELTASAAGLTDGTAMFNVGTGAVYSLMSGPINHGYAGTPIKPFTVTMYNEDNTVDVNYATPVTIYKVNGTGSVTGTLTATPFRGVATFDNVIATTAGNITIGAIVPGLPNKVLPTITINPTPMIESSITPQYVYGRFESGTCRWRGFHTPAYAQVTISGLQENTSYRYNTGAGSVETDNPTSTGSGLNIHYSQETNTYNFNSSKWVGNDDSYSTFSTGEGQTEITLWLNLVPSISAEWEPGNNLYWQIVLADQTGDVIRYYQLEDPSMPMTNTEDDEGATLIGDMGSQLSPLNYVLLFDNEAGTGRPVAISIVQSYDNNVNFATNEYRFNIENEPGAWMTQVPNTLATGVRRIEERHGQTGATVYSSTSADGVWNGIATDPTVDGPGSFFDPIYLNTPTITVSAPAAGDTLCSGTLTTISYRADGMQNVMIDYTTDGGSTWTPITPSHPADAGEYEWLVPGLAFQGQTMVRVMGVDRPNEVGFSGEFAMVEPIELVEPLSSKNLCLDDTDTLIALVSGSVESYTWYKDGTVIPDANGPVLLLTDVHYNTSGVYWVVVDGYGSCGNLTSNQSHVRVARQTQIVTQTRAVPGVIGETVSMSVTAEFPSEVISYQWYRGQTALAEGGRYFGTMSSTLEIREFEQGDYGNDYYCVVSGVCGDATSRVVRVFPTGVYVEFISPNVNACEGQDVTITADVYSNPAGEELSVRWYRNGVALSDDATYSGTMTNELTITNVSAAQAGDYTVRAVLAVDDAFTAEATATVVIATPPTINTQPADFTACAGGTATMSVAASATGDIMYQWFNADGTPVDGATSAELTIDMVTDARAGEYYVVVSTACGSETSENATLTVNPATEITTQPEATIEARVDSSFTITVAATGTGTVQYQWFKDGNELAGEVTAVYSVAAAATGDEGEYWCVVTSDCGEVTSDTATVTVAPVVSVDEDVFANGVVIGRVAPNPVASGADVTITLPASATVTMTLVDASGTVVATIANDMFAAGSHTLNIEAARLPSGAYMLQTVVGGGRHMQQVMIIK